MSIPDVIDARYRIEGLAASGGMGSVYRARDLLQDRACAVKLLNPGLQGNHAAAVRVRAEIENLANIEHEGIVRYLGSGDTDAGPYIVMEWVAGETVRDKLARDGFRLSEALQIAARITRALSVVHAAGVVHRDVTPRNIMLEEGEVTRAKLVDFGIARFDAGPGLTISGTRIGTPRYMAPEQILNARRVDGRADMFSLGCVLFEMVTGRRVFDGSDEVAVLARVLIEDAPQASAIRARVPTAIDALLTNLLARDPRRRPFASEALADEMTALARMPDSATLPPIRALSRQAPQAPTVSDEDAIPPSVLRTAATRLGPSVGAVSAAPTAIRSALVGRDREVTDLVLAANPGAVLSLWGPVGAGKSRLLAEVARALAEDSATRGANREVFAIDLHRVTDAESIVARVANALHLDSVDGTRVVRALASEPMTILFDGADASIDVLADLVQTWREAAPEITIVVATRRRFERATTSFELKPLAPEAALELLRQRIRERGHAEPPPALRTSVVPRLEGNPLLIELAAARYGVLGAEGLATRLLRPLEVFEGARTPEYRSTLEEAIEDSWNTLGENERRALAVMSTFAGAFGVDAAEAALSELGIRRVLDVLQTLRDRSLLTRRSDDRFAFSEPVRELAARKRTELGLDDVARLAHAKAIVGLAEGAASDRTSAADEARRRIVALEVELEAIGERMGQIPGGGTLALRALLAADPALVSRAPLVSHLRRIEAALAAATKEEASPQLLQHARLARGRILALRGRAEEARAELDAALAMARSANDADAEAATLLDLGVAAHRGGDLAKAEQCYEAVLALRTRYENPTIEARALGNLGAIAHDRHDLGWAYRRYVEAISLVEASGDSRLTGVFLGNLAVLDRERGDLPMAKRRFVRALEALEHVEDLRLTAVALGNLGVLELERQRTEVALSCLTRARAMLERVGDAHSEALALARQGVVFVVIGRLEDARKSLFLAARAAGAQSLASEVVTIAEAFLDADEGRFDDARKKIAAACRPGADGTAAIDRSDDVRALVRILERRLAAPMTDRPI